MASAVTTDMEALGHRPSMTDIWMSTARMLASRSRCERASVGCVVTSGDLRRVLGNGYNGRTPGHNSCPGTDPCCLHAEVDARIASGSLEKDKVMFVTLLPCEKCSMMIVNSGFSSVIYGDDHEKTAGADILRSAGVLLTRYTPPPK